MHHDASNFSNSSMTQINLQQLTSLLTFCNKLDQQADIRMRAHNLRQFVDDKAVTCCQQIPC